TRSSLPTLLISLSPATPPPTTYTLSLHDALPISAARRTERRSPPETSWTVGASGKTVGSSGPTAFAPPMRFFHIFLGRHCCRIRSEEHTSELQSRVDLVCRLLLEKKKEEQQSSIV